MRLPLLERRENVQKVAIVPITADRGLAGLQRAGAATVVRADARSRARRAAGRLVLDRARRAGSTLRFRRLEVVESWTGFSERPEYVNAQAVAHAVSEAYVKGEVDRVVVVYNAFVSALVQR